jgi:hypothetical protein
MVHSFLIGIALSRRTVVVGTTFLRGVKPSRRDIWRDVDHLGPCWTESSVEKPAFMRVCLSCVKVIMAIMCVPMVNRLCQVVMRLITALMCVLSGACRCLRPCPVMLGIQYRCLSWTRPQ